LSFVIPEAVSMPATEFLFRAQVGAALRPGSQPTASLGINPPCEVFDPGFLQADFFCPGSQPGNAYAPAGLVMISADNALAYDPTTRRAPRQVHPLRFDNRTTLQGATRTTTPGTGAGNTEALHTLLIIAENDIDANNDGCIDDPDDEAGGGSLFFEFAPWPRCARSRWSTWSSPGNYASSVPTRLRSTSRPARTTASRG
jgi:hypothetical protein